MQQHLEDEQRTDQNRRALGHICIAYSLLVERD
jgi:hypothetical protein